MVKTFILYCWIITEKVQIRIWLIRSLSWWNSHYFRTISCHLYTQAFAIHDMSANFSEQLAPFFQPCQYCWSCWWPHHYWTSGSSVCVCVCVCVLRCNGNSVSRDLIHRPPLRIARDVLSYSPPVTSVELLPSGSAGNIIIIILSYPSVIPGVIFE